MFEFVLKHNPNPNGILFSFFYFLWNCIRINEIVICGTGCAMMMMIDE